MDNNTPYCVFLLFYNDCVNNHVYFIGLCVIMNIYA